MGLKLQNLKAKEVVHLKTESEYLKFTKLLHSNGFKWCNGHAYLEFGSFEKGRMDCINVKKGERSNLEYFTRNEYKIYPASLFLNSNNYELWD